MIENKLKAIVERHEASMRGAAREMLKLHDSLLGTRYVTLPSASLWVRFKVWIKNRLARA